MLAELFEAIVEVAVQSKSHEVDIKEFPNDPDKRLVFIDGKQEILSTPRQPPDPKSQVVLLADFAKGFIRQFGDEVSAACPAVWYTISGAIFYLDEPHRRQAIGIRFTESEVFKTIRSLKDARVFKQAALVRLLRHDLAGCGASAALASFRQINWQVAKNARSNINHGNQSMDSDLVARTVGDDKPEFFNLSFKPFSSPDLTALQVGVTVTVDIDAANETITLQFQPDDIERVETAMREQILQKLTDEFPEGTCLLAGTP